MQVFGTVTSLVKSIALAKKAQDRINNPFANDKYAAAGTPKSEADSISIAARIDSIKSKMKAGMKLSGKDLEFLRKHAPSLYETAIKIVKEREDYQRRLKKCRSKEEVRRLQMEKAQSISSEAKAISSSSMDKGSKLEAMEVIQMRSAAITRDHSAFVSGSDYSRLPEKAEKNKKEIRDKKPAAKPRDADEVLLEELTKPLDDLGELFAPAEPGQAPEPIPPKAAEPAAAEAPAAPSGPRHGETARKRRALDAYQKIAEF